MENVQWKVDGMTCANCALAVNKYLKKQGAENISVNVINGDVSFVLNDNNPEQIAEGIESLGYKVVAAPSHHGHDHSHAFGAGMLGTNLRRFLFCLPFTALLLLHMFPAVHNSTAFGWIMNPWVQLALTIPPFLVGMIYFGRPAAAPVAFRPAPVAPAAVCWQARYRCPPPSPAPLRFPALQCCRR